MCQPILTESEKNLVLYGPVGIGKTHMPIIAGIKACNLGYKTKFYTVTEFCAEICRNQKKQDTGAPPEGSVQS